MRSIRTMASLALVACGGTSEEAAMVELPVTTAAEPMSATTDLGYTVVLSRVRVAATQIQFTIEGESHEKPGGVKPHPGHLGGGEVTGELAGNHILEWNGGAQPDLGLATLIVGDYQGANFAFRAATVADGLEAGDPLLDHAIHITGTVARDGTTRELDMLFDVEVDTAVVGAVFDDIISEGSAERLGIQFFVTDPFEADTAFDGVDYFALPLTGNTVAIRPGEAAHNIIRRVITTHDHFGVTPE